MRESRAHSAGAAGGGPPRHYGTIIVVGGGCYGSYYVRQLSRAGEAGALSFDRVCVVDRDPACRVARAVAAATDPDAATGRAGGPPQLADRVDLATTRHHFDALRFEVADWAAFFRHYLDRAAAQPDAYRDDAIVTSPLMPHLMYEWLLGRARRRWPGREVRTVPLPRAPATPWQRGAPDGTHYVSFAEWICPINCVEPALCPEIRGPRTWTMPAALRAYVDAQSARGDPVAGPLLLRTVHRAYGVGMFDTSEVVAADAAIEALGARTGGRILVGTVSHCHGALNLMDVGEPPP